MPQAQVNIEYVNQPKKQGGKYGNLNVGRDREPIFVPVDELRFYQKGAATVEYDLQTWGDKQVMVATRNLTDWQAPPQGGAPAAPAPAYPGNQPAPPPAGHNGAPAGDAKEKGMFVMGVVGRAMGSGKYQPQDIPLLVEYALEGWQVYQSGRRYQPPRGNEPPPPTGPHDYGQGGEPPFG